MNYKEYFNSLNVKQKEAVEATEGRIRIVAGAGSGKTKALTCRYAYLVNDIGIDPSNILCLTFTNKAAQEMRQRINSLVDNGDYNDFICTIHGFCVKILRRDIYRLGYTKSFNVLDEEDQKQLAKHVMEELGLNRTSENVGIFLNMISKTKDDNFYVEKNYIEKYLSIDMENTSNNIEENITPNPNNKVYQFIQYLNKQKKTLSLDFNDLIYFALHILNKFPDVKEYWQNELEYIMLDEAQDCNYDDWNLVEILQGIHHNLFIVGDPDQAIYEWRGAKPNMFVEFVNDKTIILDQNYRSTSNILNVANSIIKNNNNRVPKDLFTNKIGGSEVIHYHAKSEQDEVKWIIDKIKSINNSNDKSSLNDFAILYRASYLSRNIEQELVNNGIDYVIYGGIRFFDRMEIKDALAYLKLIEQGDDLSFLRICNVPSRKIGRTYINKLSILSEQEGTTLYETLKNHINDKDLNKKSMIYFIELIESCRKTLNEHMNLPEILNKYGSVVNSQRRDHVISDILDLVLEKSGYKELLRKDDNTDRLENLTELLNSIKIYEENNNQDGNISISSYLQEISLYTDMDIKSQQEKSEKKDKVRLMTIHQSKGLEFPHVFVTGLTEGIFPNMKSLRERKEEGDEEERRLMYVAVTRAKTNLFLTESEGFSFTSQMSKYPSRFLSEIQRDLFISEGDLEDTIFQKPNVNKNNKPIFTQDFKEGEKVIHPLLGEGIIQKFNVNKGTYIVKFSNGIRNIRGSYLNSVG